jgi:hypothetical protein
MTGAKRAKMALYCSFWSKSDPCKFAMMVREESPYLRKAIRGREPSAEGQGVMHPLELLVEDGFEGLWKRRPVLFSEAAGQGMTSRKFGFDLTLRCGYPSSERGGHGNSYL